MNDNKDFVDISSGAQKELVGDIQEPEIEAEEALQDQFEELEDGFNVSDEELQNTKKRPSVVIFEWVQSMINAIVIVILIFTFVVRIINVDGTSMMNTLLDGDKLLVTNYSQNYSYGDVVIISRGTTLEKVLVKRVIATEGQIVDIDSNTGKVSVDNVVLSEEYTKDGLDTFNYTDDVEFPVTVPDGMVFVLGDNRAVSKDSRDSEVGFIDVNNIIGKAQAIIFPYNRIGSVY